ncbi:hypothetical protein NIES2101_24010 [Calothrix sp. HK-06]|nr:hypothetical protein NIES2101_23875 [Calothrix sp. HK-06]OKH47333.1 hypothetical protein NIES2101_24010 [Calothrix sp. HK-06]
MVTANGETEIETSGIWGEENSIQRGIDSYGGARFGQPSFQAGDEPLSVNGDDWARGNYDSERRPTNTGGVVDKLIFKVEEEIKGFENLIAERRRYLNELKEISSQLQQAEQ